MKSKIGSLLTKITGIIYFVLAGLVLFSCFLSILGISLYQDTSFFLLGAVNILVIFLFFSLLFFVLGHLSMVSSKKMRNSKKVHSGAILAIVLGVIGLGFLVGILSLVGGIFGLIDADKKRK